MSEISGKIKLINDAETYGTFTKRSFVVTTSEQYPQEVQLECHQDKCDLLDKFKVGDEIKASLNIRGKLWINPEGKEVYFNTIVAWRIESVKATSAPEPIKAEPQMVEDDEEQDLPFN